jgi:lysophospholipase L1-like esterase
LLNVSDVQTCRDAEFCQNLNLTPQQVLEANPPLYFERNLRNLVAVARANDVGVVFSTWAYFPEPSNGSLYMTYPHMQFGVAQHNTMTRQLAADLAVPLIDLVETMPYNADFWQDGLHMTAAGALEQAEQYAAFLIDHGLIPQK